MKKLVLSLVVIMLLTTFTSCTQPSQGPTQDASPDPNENISESVIVEADSSSKDRTDLNLVIRTMIGKTDPNSTMQIHAHLLLWNVYEGLFHYGEDSVIEPRIAESYEVSDDQQTYTIYLRKGTKFHNGEEVKASDVIYSFDRAMTLPEMTSYTSCIKSYKAIDDYTVEFVSNTPMAMFIYNVSYIKIYSEKALREYGENAFLTAETSLCGTGPYYIDQFEPEKSITLKAFTDYYRGEARIKDVRYKYMTDTATALIGFEAGEFDFVDCPTANVADMKAKNKYNIYLNSTSHNTFLAMNINKEPFNNKLVRQAIGYALNKEEILYGAYDNYGDLAENWARADKIFGGTADGVTIYNYNPEKAKELLVKAGYPDGFDAGNISCIGTMYFNKAAQIIQQNLADIGIKAEVEAIEQAAVEDKLYYSQTFDMACHGDNMKIDSDIVYDAYFSTEQATTMKNMNPKIYELGNKGKTELDSNKREDIYKELWATVMDEASHIPLFHRFNPYIADPNLDVVIGVNYYYIYDWSWK